MRVTRGHPPLLPCKNYIFEQPSSCTVPEQRFQVAWVVNHALCSVFSGTKLRRPEHAHNPGHREAEVDQGTPSRSKVTAGTQDGRMLWIPPDKGNVFLWGSGLFPRLTASLNEPAVSLPPNLTPSKNTPPSCLTKQFFLSRERTRHMGDLKNPINNVWGPTLTALTSLRDGVLAQIRPLPQKPGGSLEWMRSSGLATKSLASYLCLDRSPRVVVCAGGQAGGTACVQQMCIDSQLGAPPDTQALRPSALPAWILPHNSTETLDRFCSIVA